MNKIMLKRLIAGSCLFSGTVFMAVPAGTAEASTVTGPYNFTSDTTLTDTLLGPEALVNSNSSSEAVTSNSGVTVTIHNTYTGPSGTWASASGLNTTNGGSITLDKVAITGDLYTGIWAEGGNVAVGDNLNINITQPVGTRSYGILANRYTTAASNVTVGNNAYIHSAGDAIWVDNPNATVTVGDHLTIDNGNNTPDTEGGITVWHGGTVNIGNYATINDSSVGVDVYGSATNVSLGNNATINVFYRSTPVWPTTGLLAASGNISAGNNLTINSDGYAIYSGYDLGNTHNADIGGTVTLGDNAVLKSDMTYDDSSGDMAVIRAANYGTVSLKGAVIDMDNTSSSAAAIDSSSYGSITGEGVYAITGDIRAKTNGNVNLTMNSGSTFTGKSTLIDDTATIDLSLSHSQWKVTGDSSLTNLINNNSTIDMTADNKQYSTLTIGDLSGTNGKFILDIDGTQVNKNDKIYVADTFIGSQALALKEINGRDGDYTLGKDAAGSVLASVKNNNGTFTAADGEGTLYWKRYTLDTEASSTSGYTTDWYLKAVAYVPPAEKPTTTVDTAFASRESVYYLWRDDDQLMKRLGDLRQDGENTEGFWIRNTGSEFEKDNVFGFKTKYNRLQLGYDEVLGDNARRKIYGGIAASYTDGSSTYDRGSGDNKGAALSLYRTQINNDGHYLDMVLTAGHYKNDFTAYNTNGYEITGHPRNDGVTFSTEYGYKKPMHNGWYIEPQAQLTLGYLDGDTYNTSNAVRVHENGIRSAIGRAGFNIGHSDSEQKANIYAKLNILHEFGGVNSIQMSDTQGDNVVLDEDCGGSWLQYGIGADFKLGNNARLYIDAEKGAGGGNFTHDWQWNAGARWMF